jgi:hypothetical protein
MIVEIAGSDVVIEPNHVLTSHKRSFAFGPDAVNQNPGSVV